MRIIYSNDFIRKSSIQHYPMKGFFYRIVESSQLISLLGSGQFTSDEIKDLYLNSDPGTLVSSNMYESSTIIKVDKGVKKCFISFSIDSEVSNYENGCIFIFAIDKLKYSTIQEAFFDDQAFSELAGIIPDAPSSDQVNIDRVNTNILNLNYVPTCSFEMINREQVEHHLSKVLDRANYKNINRNDQFINLYSGIQELNTKKSGNDSTKLKGRMSIAKEGVILL